MKKIPVTIRYALWCVLAVLTIAPVALAQKTLLARAEVESVLPDTEIETRLPPDDKAFSASLDEAGRQVYRERFLQAEKAAAENREARFVELSGPLRSYPLYPYLQYQWLSRHLQQDEAIERFIEDYRDSRYSRLLGIKWLKHLGRHQRWQSYLDHYSATDNTVLNCYYRLAQWHTGERQAALQGALKLWTVGVSQPSECDPLFSELKRSPLLTEDSIWQRFDAALQNDRVGLALYVKSLLPAGAQPQARLWLNLHRRPERFLPAFLQAPLNARSAAMFVHAIHRLADRDPSQAIRLWDTNKSRFPVPASRLASLEKHLAFELVFDRNKRAFQRLMQLPGTDSSVREWRVRTALSTQDWPDVIAAIGRLNAREKASDRWQYWLARAYDRTGRRDEATRLFDRLAKKRSYYGFLAADRMASEYALASTPVRVSADAIEAVQRRPAFQVAYELKQLDRDNEAKLQWWHALKTLDRQQVMAAAKLAQEWQWDEIAIFTLARVKHWDDLEMRFPLAYADMVHRNASLHDLNPAILFGLIRRESAFNDHAHSPAGARGLMQLMPGTGRLVARHFKERWRGSNSLYNPDRNVRYGSYYFRSLLERYGGNTVMALAAYNAGPHRVAKWLPESESLPADIWIETLPYKETREYIASVLAYSLIYQHRVQSAETLTISQLVDEIPATTAIGKR